jgi:hypothetical protein
MQLVHSVTSQKSLNLIFTAMRTLYIGLLVVVLVRLSSVWSSSTRGIQVLRSQIFSQDWEQIDTCGLV